MIRYIFMYKEGVNVNIESIVVPSFSSNPPVDVDIGPYDDLGRGYRLEFVDADSSVLYSERIITSGPLVSENPDFSDVIMSYTSYGYQFTGRAAFCGYFVLDDEIPFGQICPIDLQSIRVDQTLDGGE